VYTSARPLFKTFLNGGPCCSTVSVNKYRLCTELAKGICPVFFQPFDPMTHGFGAFVDLHPLQLPLLVGLWPFKWPDLTFQKNS
jgi:hypothetical protein